MVDGRYLRKVDEDEVSIDVIAECQPGNSFSPIGGNGMKTIFYAEDDGILRNLVPVSMMQSGEFQVRTFCNGREILEAVETETPDLVLIDARMPEMGGVEAVTKMRERDDLAELPVIFMTTAVLPEEVAQYRELGALAIIPKPFDPLGIANEVKAVLGKM